MVNMNPIYRPPQAAIPPIPAVVETDYHLGWNAGARSSASQAGDCIARFTVAASSVGAIVGLSNSFRVYAYAETQWGFLCARGVLSVIESGVVTPVGSYTSTDELVVQRSGNQIRYGKNGKIIRQSAVPSYGALYVESSLYSAGDTVLSAKFSGYGLYAGASAINAMQPLRGNGGVAAGVRKCSSYAAMRPMTGAATSTTQQGSFASMRPLVGSGGVKQTSSAAAMCPLQGSGGTWATYGATYCVSAGRMQPLTGSALSLTRSYTRSEGVMKPLRGFGGASGGVRKCMSAAAMQPMTGYSSAYEGNGQAMLFSTAGAISSAVATGFYLVSFSSSANGSTTMTASFLRVATMDSLAAATSTMSPRLQALAVMMSQAKGVAQTPGLPASTWVVNAETGAAWRYENFDFESFCEIDGICYGCRADGLYQLTGDTDDGAPIAARVDLGRWSGGTTLVKGLLAAYAGVISDSPLVLSVGSARQGTFDYLAKWWEPSLSNQLFSPGRGLQGSWLSLAVSNVAGADFELASLELVPTITSRRV